VKEITPKEVYRAEISKTAPDATNITLEGPKIPEGKVVHIRMFYAIDLTTAAKTLRIGYDRGGTKHWVKREAAGTGKYGIWQNQNMFLVENERPICMIETPTASDECKLVVRGVYL